MRCRLYVPWSDPPVSCREPGPNCECRSTAVSHWCDCDGRCAGARLPAPWVKPFAARKCANRNAPCICRTSSGRHQPCPVAKAGHPNHGDQTVRFPVVTAVSQVSLVSLAGTYSTGLFAMMSTPQWRTDCDQGLLVGVQVQAPDRPT